MVAVVVVVQFAVARECAVLEHQRNVVVAVRQPGVDLGVVLQQVKAGKPHVQIASAVAPAMIVIPE